MRKYIILTILLVFILVKNISGQTQLSVSEKIGEKGGTISLCNEDATLIIILTIPEGALFEDKEITLSITKSISTSPIKKSIASGINIKPAGIFFQEMAKIEISTYNDLSPGMILCGDISPALVIPCATQQLMKDENMISGGTYLSGTYSLYQPTLQEMIQQNNRLAEYRPGTSGSTAAFRAAPPDDNCIRWQHVSNKVRGHLEWQQQFMLLGNEREASRAEKEAANALNEGIEEFLNRPEPPNPCGSYIMAAAKYLEGATALGLNIENKSSIARKFDELVDKCSFTFSLETREWINHPKETNKLDKSTLEEQMTRYGNYKFYMKWKKLVGEGVSEVKGSGIETITWEKHWVGETKYDHYSMSGSRNVIEVEGSVTDHMDEHGVSHPVADLTITYKNNITTRIDSKMVESQDPFKSSGTDNSVKKENISFTLKNGYEERIGNSAAGRSLRVFLLNAPGLDRKNPDDCY
jgi:hypothetical protein